MGIRYEDGTVALAQADTSLDFPDKWAWPLEQVLAPGFWPD